MVEDSSLCLHALCGLPGPYVKYFEDKIGPKGIFRMLKDFNDKSATAHCHIGLLMMHHHQMKAIEIFSGRCHGTIVEPKDGIGFGWDACFQPDGYQAPFSCLTSSVKNVISHRAHAFQQLNEYLKNMN